MTITTKVYICQSHELVYWSIYLSSFSMLVFVVSHLLSSNIHVNPEIGWSIPVEGLHFMLENSLSTACIKFMSCDFHTSWIHLIQVLTLLN